MGFMEAIFALPAIAAVIAVYFYLDGQPISVDARGVVAHRRRPRLRLLRHADVVKMYHSHHPHVLFYLKPNGEGYELQHRAQFIHDFVQEAVWIPAGTSVFLVSETGFSKAMLHELEQLNTSREFFLISGRQDAELLNP